MKKVLIIGYGLVGQHTGKYFTYADYVDKDGIVRNVKSNDASVHTKWDIAFISVPTPMQDNGRCDMSYIYDVLTNWKDKVNYFCSRSTVEIGTTDYVNDNLETNFCVQPEYLGMTPKHVMVEPKGDPFIILGGSKDVTKIFAEEWMKVTNAYAQIFQTEGKTAECVKLMENTFLATKVIFMNEWFDIAENVGVNFNELRELWLLDPRVSRDHTYCYRDKRGFGGRCLPKDLNNLVYYCRNFIKKPAKMIEFILGYNKELRANNIEEDEE